MRHIPCASTGNTSVTALLCHVLVSLITTGYTALVSYNTLIMYTSLCPDNLGVHIIPGVNCRATT